MPDLATAVAVILCGVLVSAASADQRVTVGDESLQVSLDLKSGILTEALPGLTGTPWALQIEGSPAEPTNAVLAGSTPRKAVFRGEDSQLAWVLSYELTGPGRITKSLEITSKSDFVLQSVSMWSARSAEEPIVSGTGLQDIAAFYRHAVVSGLPSPETGAGLFASLDFPYSKITRQDNLTQISYPPHVALKAGEKHKCHSLTFGATRLTGRIRYGFDDGEVEAMDSYIQQRFRPRFDRPMFVSCCINNRYTQLDGKTIFHTMADHPTLGFNLDLLKREIALMPQIGMEYYQVFPGVFDWSPDDPKRSDVREIVAFGTKHGVRVGDYSGANSVFCGHYNEHGNSLDKPEWRMKAEDGQHGGFCFGSPEFVDYCIKTVAANCKEFGFELHCLDFLGLSPCHATNHGHPAGPDSLYHQMLGLTRFVQAINDVSPRMMTWPNSGNWQAFLPKLAWYTHNLYLTDPYIDKPWQGLNATSTMDDVRREQMVRLHYTHFLPYRFFTNCQYFFCQNSIVPDIRSFEYGALSTLAVTPNLCLAEVRPWMDTLTAAEQDRVKAFYTRWTTFLKKNFELWKKTYSAGEEPGPGAVEIYGHAKGDQGFVFIVNPNYWGRTVEVPIDESLGFSDSDLCEVAELYPIERLRPTSQGPFAGLGSKLAVHVAARQVLVLEVRPAPKSIDRPRLYGLPGTIERTGTGHLIKTTGTQGAIQRFAVLLPSGSEAITSAEARPDVPKQPKRAWAATPIKMIGSEPVGAGLRAGSEAALFEITFRRGLAPTELRDWQAKPGGLADADKFSKGFADGESLAFPLFAGAEGVTPPVWDSAADSLGLGPLASFCGGYIDNAFSEQQETWIDLKTGGAPVAAPSDLTSGEAAPGLRPLPAAAKSREMGWWLKTTFDLPFMYGLGMEPRFEDHTLLALPFIRRSSVREIRAWINGTPLDVRDYRYPRNRGFGCYWADLVGSGARFGENTLVIHFEAR